MKKYLLGIIFILSVNLVNAQEEKINDFGSWYTLINKFKVSEKLYFLNVAECRQYDFIKSNRIFLVMPSVNYKLSNKITVGVGYMYLNYNQAGEVKPGLDYENRFWQHTTLYSSFGKIKMNQRFMVEERWKTTLSNIESYANRFRYRMNLDFNLFKLKNSKPILGRISEEIRIKFANKFDEPDFDQNNFKLLVGYQVLDNSKLYVGYGRNYYKRSSGYWGDHLLLVVFYYNFDFIKNLK